jgi:tetratricopeptide (TPR) repeat protein
VIFIISSNNIAQLTENNESALISEYPSLNEPGLLPMIFGADIISLDTTRDRDITFSSDMNELYFTRSINRQLKIYIMKKVNGVWTMPQPASFTDEYQSAEPVFSPDGRKLFYISTRPLSGSGDEDNFNIWFVKKENENWGIPKRLSESIDFYPTFTKENKVYFTDAQNDLYTAELKNSQLVNRQKLSENINTIGAEYNSMVAHDESYLIFTSFGWGDGFGGGDLFISFKDENGDWNKPINMGGGINSNGHEYCPSLSPDGKYLFFTSNKNNSDDIYWVDAAIIDVLKTTNLNISDHLVTSLIKNGDLNLDELYGSLEDDYSRYCYFSESVLDNVGNRLIGLQKTDEALMAFDLILKIYPDDYNDFHKLKTALLNDDNRTYERLRQKYIRKPQLIDGRFEFNINTLGYRFLFNQYLNEALKTFELYVNLMPNSFNSYDSYGEALLATGDTTQAIVNYKKSLELNPNNNNAVQVLKAINP